MFKADPNETCETFEAVRIEGGTRCNVPGKYRDYRAGLEVGNHVHASSTGRVTTLFHGHQNESRSSILELPAPSQPGLLAANPRVINLYLAAQGLAPYFAMGDRYGEVYERMVGLLERLAPAESARRAERRVEVDEMDPGAVATSFFDVDATVGAYCRDRGLDVPAEIDALIDLHIRAVGAWLDDLEARLAR